jgi:hypothetical protein
MLTTKEKLKLLANTFVSQATWNQIFQPPSKGQVTAYDLMRDSEPKLSVAQRFLTLRNCVIINIFCLFQAVKLGVICDAAIDN